jgi:hypothetical protein
VEGGERHYGEIGMVLLLHESSSASLLIDG